MTFWLYHMIESHLWVDLCKKSTAAHVRYPSPPGNDEIATNLPHGVKKSPFLAWENAKIVTKSFWFFYNDAWNPQKFRLIFKSFSNKFFMKSFLVTPCGKLVALLSFPLGKRRYVSFGRVLKSYFEKQGAAPNLSVTKLSVTKVSGDRTWLSDYITW